MEKIAKAFGVITVIIVLVLFVYDLFMFAKTGDLTYGIWAILLSLTMRVSVTVKPTEGERK